MPKGKYLPFPLLILHKDVCLGRNKVHHKGKAKKYLTEEEIRIADEKKSREKEWKV